MMLDAENFLKADMIRRQLSLRETPIGSFLIKNISDSHNVVVNKQLSIGRVDFDKLMCILLKRESGDSERYESHEIHSTNRRSVGIVFKTAYEDVIFLNVDISQNTWVNAYFFGNSREGGESTIEDLFKKINGIAEPLYNAVRVKFAYMGANGLRIINETTDKVPWEGVRQNYNGGVQSQIEDAIKEMNKQTPRGRILVWYGPPGTGKTYAIRAFIHAVSGMGIEPYVILDPVRFTSDPAYYYELISRASDEPQELCSDGSYPKNAQAGVLDIKRKLFIFEDCAQLLTDEAVTAGCSVSLLNISDGLFCTSLNSMFLITFNQDIGRLGEAFLRPGRCMQCVNFPVMGRVDAEKWLGQSLPSGKDLWTLAELYAIKNKISVQNEMENKRIRGFRL